MDFRIPRILFVALMGSSLAILGASYQIAFQNSLAEPYVLGISSAAALAAVIGENILGFPAGGLSTHLFAALGASVATVLLLTLCMGRFGDSSERILLFGMGMNFVLSSTLFLILSYTQQQMGGGSMRWLFGQIRWASYTECVALASVAIFLFCLLFYFGRHFDALHLGEQVARTLGVSAPRIRTMVLIATSMFVGVSVTMAGSIGFVGLVVPHAVRLWFKPSSSRSLLMLCLCMGAFFLVGSDIVSRVLLPPFEFPIGIVTTLLGGPIFLGLLWRRV